MLNLAVQKIYSEVTNPEYFNLVLKVQSLMVDLRTLKNKIKLAVHTNLNPQLRNDTRWGSTYAMLQKYLELCKATNHFKECSFSRSTKNLIPIYKLDEDSDNEEATLTEHDKIVELTNLLKEFESVSKWLQTENPKEEKKRVTMYTVRAVFDKLCEKYPIVEPYLSSTASIIHNHSFEIAVAKVQGNEITKLTKNEKNEINFFLLDEDEDQNSDNCEEDNEMDLLGEALDEADENAKKRIKTRAYLYRSLMHISPTSNIVERLFSRAGIIMRPHRRLMDPSTLEMLLLLRFNKDLWDEREIEEVMVRETRDGLQTALETPATPLSTQINMTPVSISSFSVPST